MKNKKSLLYLIAGIILVVLISISGLDIENTYNNTNHISNYIVITDVGEFPESFSLAEDSNLQILFFDVGQADSILVTNKGTTMLIDAGSRKNGELLVEYMKQLNITKIDYLIGTHAHEDHIGGMSDIINNFDIGKFFMPFVDKRKTKTYIDMEEAASKKGIDITNPAIGTNFSIGDANCIIKYIDNTEPNNVNNSSIILQLTLGEADYLFMGDAEEAIENLGKSKDENKKIDWTKINVLKVSHHGSSTSSTKDFLNKTSPEIAIISVGENNYGHPSESVIKRLITICGISNVYRTDRDGTIYLENIGDVTKITKLETNF